MLPEDERVAVERHFGDCDRQTETQKQVERDIASTALEDEDVKRLMTIPGIGMIVAVGVMAAIGRIDRLATADQLAAYFVSIQAYGSPATGRPIAAGSPSMVEAMPGIFQSRR